MSCEIIQINQNTWRIENGFVRCFLLCGTERAMMIDSGVDLVNAREIGEKITDLPLILVNTHGDGDHICGNGSFESFYMSQSDYENCNVAARFPNVECLPICEGDCFNLGDREIEVIGLPSHTKGSVALLDRKNRMLFSGDSVQTGYIYMFGKHRDPSAFSECLQKLMGMREKFDFIYPSHGIYELPADYVGKIEAAWKKVLSGEIEGKPENVNGVEVKNFDCGYCGFYC